MINKIEKLEKRIKDEIEKKAIKYELMGTEDVSITLKLTEEEVQIVQDINLPDNYLYDLDGDLLSVIYCENSILTD
jgi:hypothetical protein